MGFVFDAQNAMQGSNSFRAIAHTNSITEREMFLYQKKEPRMMQQICGTHAHQKKEVGRSEILKTVVL
jgi:hypothetical protein